MGRQGFFTAQELAARFDISVETIRSYARNGLLRPVELNDGEFFTPGDFTRIEIIQRAKFFGFSMNEIKRILDSVRRPDQDTPSEEA